MRWRKWIRRRRPLRQNGDDDDDDAHRRSGGLKRALLPAGQPQALEEFGVESVAGLIAEAGDDQLVGG